MQSTSESLRIGYVLKRFPRFSETFILNELLSLQSQGVDLDVFSLLKPPEEKRHARLAYLKAPVIGLSPYSKAGGVHLHHGMEGDTVPLTDLLESPDDPLFAGKTRTEIAALFIRASVVAMRARSRGIKHLHAHFGSDATTVALLAARLTGGSYSFTAHARDIYHTYVDEAADLAMRQCKIREAAFVTTVSDYNADYLRKICPEAEQQIIRLYNGIDLKAFTPVMKNQQVANRIIAVGRLVEKKGFPVLVNACAQLRDRGVWVECRLVGDGPLEESLKNQIQQLRLQNHVHLDGALPQEELIRLMDTACAAVLPCVVAKGGDRDGLPTVLLEAMARALPVVTTTVSGGPEIVDHETTGYLCAPGDAESLSQAIEKLMLNPQLATAMGNRGRNKAEEKFDLNINVATLQQLFKNQLRVDARSERVA